MSDTTDVGSALEAREARELDVRDIKREAELLASNGVRGQHSNSKVVRLCTEVVRVRAERDALARGLAAAEGARDELLAVLEPLLVQVEPLRYEQRAAIDKACSDKAKWAEDVNRRASNSNEMWFYMTEFRGALERRIEPLAEAVRKANEVYDRVVAALPPADATTPPRAGGDRNEKPVVERSEV